MMKKYLLFTLSCLLLGLASCSDDDNNDVGAPSITLETNEALLIYGESKEIKVAAENVVSYTFDTPSGWQATIANNILTVKAPEKDNTEAVAEGKILVTAKGADNTNVTAEVAVSAGYKRSLITFEDEEGASYWLSKIDNPQYNGELLYGDKAAEYSWIDKETNLFSRLNSSSYGIAFWSGGLAISNYASTDIAANSSFDNQLTAYGTGGNNGSKNFAVSFGYVDDSGFSMEDGNPRMSFADGVPKTIEYMYIASTTYFLSVAMEGNGLSPAIGDDSVWVTATGYINGQEGNTVTTYLAKDGDLLVKEWTKWNLSELGKVDEVRFNIGGGTDNGYGFSLPAYFAIDDIMVVYN